MTYQSVLAFLSNRIGSKLYFFHFGDNVNYYLN